jgi:hypothetical protein
MHNKGGMISIGENSLFVYQNSLTILTAESCSSKAGVTGEGNHEFLPYEVSLSQFEGF